MAQTTHLFRSFMLTMMLFSMPFFSQADGGNVDSKEIVAIPLQVKENIQARVNFGLLKGLVVGISDGHDVSFFHVGVTDNETNQAIDENTIFEIGSISKIFTASLLALTMQDEEVNENDTLDKYLEIKPNHNIFNQITLTSLANHHSGLARIPDNFAPKDALNPYADYDEKMLLNYLTNIKVNDLEPGHYQYSNTGAGLLGLLLANKSGLSYQQLLQAKITQPLAMHHTFAHLPEKSLTLAKGHNGNIVPNWTFDALVGAGGIYSSASDMLTFLSANIRQEENVLTRALKRTHHISKANIFDNTSIGLGWFVEQQSNGPDIIYHDGNTYGYWSFAGFLADGSKAVVVLSNSGNEDINDIGFHLLNAQRPLQHAPTYQEITLTNEQLKQYGGRYLNDDGFEFEVTLEKQQLYVAFNGQPKLAIYPQSRDKFFYRDLRAEIIFSNQDSQRQLMLIQDGEQFIAIKKELAR